jgi:transposase
MVKLKFRFTTVRFPFSRGRLAGAQIRGGGHRARVVRDCVKNFRDASARHHEVDALSELDLHGRQAQDKQVASSIVLPKRWVVESTLGWINRARRLSKDFEATIESSLAWLQLALAFLLMRRLARAKFSHA